MNEIVFPAGILQPPFFDLTADDAVNYGGIGAVIGHEISHGFDDQGSRSDAEGNWRTGGLTRTARASPPRPTSSSRSTTIASCSNDLHVNGKLTLGENIADLGGVTIAYAAYQKSLERQEGPGDRRLHRRRSDSSSASPKSGAARSATPNCGSGFAPIRIRQAQFRTLVPLSNVEAFYEAFDIKPGDAMYRDPKERVKIW